jgi:predicted nucleic acid-binding protein
MNSKSEAARLAGSWLQKYEATGLGWMDALVTATAKMANVSLLTHDKRLARVLAHEANFEVYE